MNPLLDAAHPHLNATVSASAGTGKTWLLVTRMIRLLLAGARPDGILAVTFTRKAAAEMSARLLEVLHRLATIPDEALATELSRIGVAPTPDNVRNARGLHEALLRAARPPRATTFHSFCHDLLKRFPLEADVTPGFELVESTKTLERDAVQALYSEATLNPDSEFASAIEAIYARFGHASTEEILQFFLDRRSEWWAYTHFEADPPAFAREKLRKQLKAGSDAGSESDPLARHAAGLREFAELLDKHFTKTNQAHASLIRTALASDADPETRVDSILAVFLTGEFAPRARKQSAAQTKSMGSESERRFLSLHEQLSEACLAWVDARRARATLALSSAWFSVGHRLLQIFQRLKEERRQLDFSDLEWKTFVLLTSNGHAHWVQYKLDQRIDHLLIDEFQDTSPIQWQMILPLLQELASAPSDRNRTVFFVGDEKQSIYQFRRADPRLFRVAQDWLASRLDARPYALDSSRRSAPAIIRLINAVFDQPEARDHITEFPIHETHRHDLWGHVEVLPLADSPDVEAPPPSLYAPLRNPLLQPRATPQQTAYDREAAIITRKILELVESRAPVGAHDTARAVAFSDILILLRNRTHVGAFERALRAAHIPFAGAERGTLLQSREISDLVDLLDVLATPFNNLAFATVLRCPLFCCTEEHLSQLALMGETGSWAQRLATLAPSLAESNPLRRAHYWLSRWSAAAGHLPVHDLIDRIYCEGCVVKRYTAAAPTHLRPSVRSNLEQFVDLALELDSGRYPSLGRFVESTRAAQRGVTDAPDADTLSDGKQGVRVMTIHSAKGLEAPVVFLADAANESARSPVANVFVAWEPTQDRPESFYLTGSKPEFDALSRAQAADNDRRRARENLNLLYVALTRARQMLFLSGSTSKRSGGTGWYQLVRNGLATLTGDDATLSYADPKPPLAARPQEGSRNTNTGIIPPELGLPLPVPELGRSSTPSARGVSGATSRVDSIDIDAVERGVAIHRLIELMCESAPVSDRVQRGTIAALLRRELTADEFNAWRDEAERVVNSPNLRPLFDRTLFLRAYSEVPLAYVHAGRVVNGVADRIVVRDDDVTIVDYKTHRVENMDAARGIADRYRDQMTGYARGAVALWPGRPVRALIVFTSLAAAVELGAA